MVDASKTTKRPTVDVVIGVYGDKHWDDLAIERAVPSVWAQGAQPLLSRAGTLAAARNRGAAASQADLLVFLDADDELAPGYLKHMADAAYLWGLDNLFQPETVPADPDGRWLAEPNLIKPRAEGVDEPLAYGNWMVIGTAIATSTFLAVGGFRDLPVLEDYDLWCRAHRAGAGFRTVPGAVYVVHETEDGRNNQDRDMHNRVFRQIRDEYF